MFGLSQKEICLSISKDITATIEIQEVSQASVITIVEPPTANVNEEHKNINTTSPDTPYSIFTAKQKVIIVVIISMSSFVSSFSANIYYPALRIIQKVSRKYRSILQYISDEICIVRI